MYKMLKVIWRFEDFFYVLLRDFFLCIMIFKGIDYSLIVEFDRVISGYEVFYVG